MLSVNPMLMPCEIAVKSVVPSIRASIAIELTKSYHMKQNDVANILGITQTAISKYTRQVRGTVIKIDESEEIRSMILQVTGQIADKKISRQDLASKFCEICQVARRNGLMCELCKRNDPSIDIETCQICKSSSLNCKDL
jgi:predicted transcriptional regulator